MITIKISGKIKFNYSGGFGTIKLLQSDGYKINLVDRFKEAIESFPNQNIQVNYYISDKECSEKNIKEGFLKKIFGDVDASYEANDYCYSAWTSGTDYDTNLTIGGHDLYNELVEKDGKYIFIELNFNDVV